MNKTYDILIIGSGMTGLMTAYFLKEEKKKVILVSQEQLEKNATSKSTGKISYLQKDIYQKLEKAHNYQTSKSYFLSQKEAMNQLVEIIQKEKIDCDLKKIDTYLFTTNKYNRKKIEKERELLESFGVTTHSVDSLPVSYKIEDGFYIKDNYIFNPLKFLSNIKDIVSQKIVVKDYVLVTDIKKKKNHLVAETTKGSIEAKKIVVATHYPFFTIKNLIPLRVYVKQEYITTSEIESNASFSAINIEEKTQSIRCHQNKLMYIASSNKSTSKKFDENTLTKDIQQEKQFFPLEKKRSHLNQDIITNDYLPIIGYTDSNKNILIATGFNGWGNTNGVLSAMIISKLLKEEHSLYEDLFKVNRISMTGVLNSTINGVLEAKAYIKNIFYQPEKIYKIKIKGKNYYLYVDKNHQRHYIETKCPHMKCNLLFNKEELTWDCPCHGSRFDLDGNVLESPSKKCIGKEKD